MPGIIEKVARILLEKKAMNIIVIDISNVLGGLYDYFIIASGYTEEHLRALTREVEKKLKGEKIPLHHIEGYEAGQWILLDYGEFAVHLFSEDMRSFYDLESLWGDQPVWEFNES